MLPSSFDLLASSSSRARTLALPGSSSPFSICRTRLATLLNGTCRSNRPCLWKPVARKAGMSISLLLGQTTLSDRARPAAPAPVAAPAHRGMQTREHRGRSLSIAIFDCPSSAGASASAPLQPVPDQPLFSPTPCVTTPSRRWTGAASRQPPAGASHGSVKSRPRTGGQPHSARTRRALHTLLLALGHPGSPPVHRHRSPTTSAPVAGDPSKSHRECCIQSAPAQMWLCCTRRCCCTEGGERPSVS